MDIERKDVLDRCGVHTKNVAFSSMLSVIGGYRLQILEMCLEVGGSSLRK